MTDEPPAVMPSPSPSGDPPASPADPGRVTLRRLNRIEYDNTVRDLLGTKLRPAQAFEPDPIGFGFDNNGDVQTLTTLQLEQYAAAAESLVAEATTGGLDRIAAAARVPACDPAASACAEALVRGLARRAWRRPPAADELGRVLGVARAAAGRGEPPLAQLRLALAAVLVSPHFLFRVELDPDPRSTSAHALSPFELATRLSYLVYRSMPDDALLDAAEGGRLATERDIAREVERMLGDPRGAALADGFAGQWLDLDSLDQHDVDSALFGPAYDRALGQDMRVESMAFFAAFVAGNLAVPDMLSARFTFVNARLAQHYGLPAPAGQGFQRVALGGDRRVGLLTQASVLTATSLPNRTSPVARGAWVLSHLLCAPPPPPPPDVPALPEPDPTKFKSGRALLEEHRRNPACSACHEQIDPIGLGLENYDAIGRWRDQEGGAAIDASGTLPEGATFVGAAPLAALLAGDPRVARCAAANLYTYAVSRPADKGADAAHVDAIVTAATRQGRVGVRDLLLALATSAPFRQRRGEPAANGGQP